MSGVSLLGSPMHFPYYISFPARLASPWCASRLALRFAASLLLLSSPSPTLARITSRMVMRCHTPNCAIDFQRWPLQGYVYSLRHLLLTTYTLLCWCVLQVVGEVRALAAASWSNRAVEFKFRLKNPHRIEQVHRAQAFLVGRDDR